MIISQRSLALIPLVLGAASLCSADLVYSDFSSGMSFDTNVADSWGINGFLNASSGQQAISEDFTPTGDYIFTDAQVK
jgi:hypothetical protein